MKFVGNLLRLRGAFFCRSGIRSSPIAANDFNFRVGQQPGFDGLLPTVGKQLDWLPSLKVDHQGAVDLARIPRPVINAQNTHRHGGSTRYSAKLTGPPRPATRPAAL